MRTLLQFPHLQTIARKELKSSIRTQRLLIENVHPEIPFPILRQHVAQYDVEAHPLGVERKEARGNDLELRDIRDRLDDDIRFHYEMQDG